MRVGFIISLFILLTLAVCLNKPKTFPWALVQDDTPDNHLTSYQELYFPQKVSHFNYKYATTMWQQRYLIDLNQWSTGDKGPILMYMGN